VSQKSIKTAVFDDTLSEFWAIYVKGVGEEDILHQAPFSPNTPAETSTPLVRAVLISISDQILPTDLFR
jgi:hypothetical protein